MVSGVVSEVVSGVVNEVVNEVVSCGHDNIQTLTGFEFA